MLNGLDHKNRMRLRIHHLFSLFIVIIAAIGTYWELPKTFFQQDEWQTLSTITYYYNKGISGVIKSFLPADAFSHFNPLAAIFPWFEYILYYTNFSSYAWQSIILHIVNSVLLYTFVFFWFKRKGIAFVAALFFAVNSIPHQAVTWVVNTNSYEVSTIFILLSLLFFQQFVSEKRHRRMHIFFSIGLLFISLLFHENGIFLFLFYPLIVLLQQKLERKKLLPILSTVMAVFVFIFFLIRVPFFFGFLHRLPAITDITHPPIMVYPYRIVSYIFKSLAGSVIPERNLIFVSEQVTRLAYPQFLTPDNLPNPYVAQSIVFDMMSYVITIFFACLIIFFIRLTQQKKFVERIVWSLIFILTSILPYGFVLGKAGYASILEPKFFYVASIGVSMLIALIIASLVQRFSGRRIFITGIYFLYGLYILFHVFSVRTYLDNLKKISVQRKAFLTTIQSSYQRLPQQVIFFTQSDTAYYGMPDTEKNLPVQVGFGKMLMVWYQKKEQFPSCLYEDHFLLDLLSQGYRYCDGRGFGYFRQYDKLLATLKENKLLPEDVIAYSWNGKTQKFTSITGDIRRKLKEVLDLQ